MNMPTNAPMGTPHAMTPLPVLCALRDSAAEEVESAKSVLDAIVAEINKRIERPVADVRSATQKTEGAINCVVDDCDVKHTVPKQVKWDHKQLVEVCGELARGGVVDPQTIVTHELSVAERTYDALPPALKKLFSTARTLKHGKPKIEVNPR